VTSDLSSSRYFYRACQGSLFPSPVQLGRQLDKLPPETRRNILNLGGVAAGSAFRPAPHFLSRGTPSPEGPDGDRKGAGPRAVDATEKDTLPFAKDAAKLRPELRPRPPEGGGRPPETSETLEPSDLSASSLHLTLPPGGDAQRVRYSRKSAHGAAPGAEPDAVL